MSEKLITFSASQIYSPSSIVYHINRISPGYVPKKTEISRKLGWTFALFSDILSIIDEEDNH